jgi:diguanylate cyclase (GGDEF)-like protein
MYDPRLVELFIEHLDELVASGEEASKDMPQLSFRTYFEKVDLALASANSVASLPSLTPASSSELVALYEFCNSFGKHLDLSDSLPILTRRLKRLLPFSTIAFFLDDGEDCLRAAYISGKYSDQLQNLTIGYGKGISGWVAAYQRPMFNTGPALEFQGVDGDYTSLSDTLVVPLVADGISLGTISLYGQAPIFYSQTHLGILQMVAGQVAPLIAEVKNHTAPSSAEDLIDPVTQTPRAVYLPVSGAQMIAAAEKNQAPMALLYVDLKDYQHLLNLYGLETGHSILRKVAEVLKSELRETDVVVRYGHEGFVALLAGVGGERARRYAQRVQQQIRATPVGEVAGHSIFVGGQTAVASFPENGSTIPALLEFAHRSIAEQSRPAQKAGEEDEGNILEFPPRI